MTKSTAHHTGIVGLAGYSGAAKDIVADVLYAKHGYRTFTLSDNVREALLALDPMLSSDLSLAGLVDQIGWDQAMDHRVHGPEVRRLTQVMGTEVGRVFFGPGAWTNLLRADIDAAGGFSPSSAVVVDDIHDDDEAQWVRSLGGQVWHVTTLGAGPMHRQASEYPISSELVDHVILYDGDAKDVSSQIDRILTPAATPGVTSPKEVAPA